MSESRLQSRLTMAADVSMAAHLSLLDRSPRRNTMALKPIAYVQASWHADFIDHCETAFIAEITTPGYRVDEVEFFSAPSSLEIPLIAKKLAKSGRYAAVCASRLVVDGGI